MADAKMSGAIVRCKRIMIFVSRKVDFQRQSGAAFDPSRNARFLLNPGSRSKFRQQNGHLL
jgi:hypothetical protein